jgi:hypothetical protein
MEDKFEHQIADQVSGFQLTPSSQVWKGVVLELDKEKSKKRGIFWWMPLGLLVIGLAGWFLFTSTESPKIPSLELPQKNDQKELSNRSIPTKDSIETVNQISPSKEPFQKQDAAIVETSKTLLVQQNIQTQQPTMSHQQPETSLSSSHITSIDSAQVFKETTHTTNHQNQVAVDKGESRQISQTIIQETTTKKDSNVSSVPTAPLPSKKPSKSSWRLQVALGSTRLSETSLLGNSTAADRAAFANNSSAVVSGFPNTIGIEASNKGFHAAIGLSKNWILSKRWELAAGLSYRYLQNQQMTGLKKDSSYLISSQSNSSNKAITVNDYYLAGSQNNLINRTHWLMMPIQVRFNLNPSSKLNWLLFGGSNLSWNFASNWLLVDQANNILYEARPLTNLVGIHAQLGIELRNQKSQSLSLGWEKSMNSMSKLNQSKQYWNQLQLQYSQPIYLKKSSKK